MLNTGLSDFEKNDDKDEIIISNLDYIVMNFIDNDQEIKLQVDKIAIYKDSIYLYKQNLLISVLAIKNSFVTKLYNKNKYQYLISFEIKDKLNCIYAFKKVN